MPLKYPDILEHNNPDLPIVDISNVKGGLFVVDNLTELVNQPIDKVTQYLSKSWVISENKYYIFTGTDPSNISDWTIEATGGSGGISSGYISSNDLIIENTDTSTVNIDITELRNEITGATTTGTTLVLNRNNSLSNINVSLPNITGVTTTGTTLILSRTNGLADLSVSLPNITGATISGTDLLLTRTNGLSNITVGLPSTTGMTYSNPTLTMARVNASNITVDIGGTLQNLIATRIPFATGTTSVGTSTNLVWDNTGLSLLIGNPTTGATPAGIEIQPVSGRAALRLYNSTPSSPSTGEIWYQSANTEFVFNGAIRLQNLAIASDILRSRLNVVALGDYGGGNLMLRTASTGTTGDGFIGVTESTSAVTMLATIGATVKNPFIQSVEMGGSITSTLTENRGASTAYSLSSLELWMRPGAGTINPSVPISLQTNSIRVSKAFATTVPAIMSDYHYITNGDSITTAGTVTIGTSIKHGPTLIRQGANTLTFNNITWGLVGATTSGNPGVGNNGNGYGLFVAGIPSLSGATPSNLYGMYMMDYSSNTLTIPSNFNTLSGRTTTISGYSNRWGIYLDGTNPSNVGSYIGHRLSIGQSTAPTAVSGITAILDIGASTTSLASLRLRAGSTPTSPNDGDIWFDGTNLYIRISGITRTVTVI